MTHAPNESPESSPDGPRSGPPSPDPSHCRVPGEASGVHDPTGAPAGPPRVRGTAGMIVGIGIAGFCLIALAGVVVFLVVAPDDDGSVAGSRPAAPSSPHRPPVTGSANPLVDPDAAIAGDGTYVVGEDFEAGEYSTTVPDTSPLCYWERLSGISGEFDDIIANGVADPGEKVTVTIDTKDAAFTSQGCGAWNRA